MKTWIIGIVLGFGVGTLAFIPSCKPKIKLEDTVVSVKEIKAIGDLISAEYYGEVLSSLSLIQSDRIDSIIFEKNKLLVLKKQETDSTFGLNKKYLRKDSDLNEKERDLLKFELELADLKKENPKDKRKIRQLEKEIKKLKKEIKRLIDKLDGLDKHSTALQKDIDKVNNRLKNDPRNASLIRKKRRLEKRSANRKQRHYFRNLDTAEVTAMRDLKKFFNDSSDDIYKKTFSKEDSLNSFKEVYKNEVEKYKSKKIKEDFAYLARGIVQVGYDLQSLDSLNIFTSPKGDTIYLLDFDPILFQVDINPWFRIPEDSAGQRDNNLFGFEMVYADTKRNTNITFQKITELKSRCKSLLRQQALDANIYEHAHDNAEEALLGFFQLLSLIPGQEVKSVVISHSKYFNYKEEYLFDQKIDEEEIDFIYEIIQDDHDTLDDVFFKYQTIEYQRIYLD